MAIKVKERVPNFVDRSNLREAVVKTFPEIAKIDWIKEKSHGNPVALKNGLVINSDNLAIAFYEEME